MQAEQPPEERPPETLAQVAASLAQAHSAARLRPGGWRRAWLPTGLGARFDRIFDTLAELDPTVLDRTSGSELLLENDYVIRQALVLVRDNTPKDGYRRLPRLREGPRRGDLRVIAVADEILNVCGAPLDLYWAGDFLRCYQGEVELTLGELWALPNLLRILVLQRLLQAAQSALQDATGEGAAEHDYGSAISGLLLSLRALSAEDWARRVESVSVVHRILAQDPAGAYERMDRETRNRYRTRVEKLARATRCSESGVARQAVELADSGLEPRVIGANRRQRMAHVGYYLLDDGCAELLAALNRRRGRLNQVGRWLGRHAHRWYLGAIALLAVMVTWQFLSHAWPGATTVTRLVAIPVAVILALTMAVHLVNYLTSLVARPRVLPKMDFRDGVPAEFATVVVMPALLGSATDVESLLRRLETSYLGNRDASLRYALLTDPPDADSLTRPDDDTLLELATRGIEELNDRYRGDRHGAGPFFLFHRPRQWNAQEGCYLAWERKRGKLEEFNALLLEEPDKRASLRVGAAEDLEGMRFVITLDADTQLLRGAARALIGTLAHPLNQPVTNSSTGHIEAGYSIVQPRIEVDPDVARQNSFTRAVAGDVVLDLYSRAVSNVYQDLFGAGIYTGKGIYDVRAFAASLRDRVPSNAILSHDLFEGLHGRVGLATDIVLLEGFPDNALSHARRAHRWVRGDWQLLPWLGPRVPLPGGGRGQNRFSVLGRWKIIDNLCRSLFAPAAFAAFVLAWVALPGAAWAWTCAALVATLLPIALSSVHALGTGIAQGGTWPAVQDRLQASLHGEVMRGFFLLAFLPYQTFVNLDAIARACWRVFVSRQRLLQWVPAEETTRRVRGGLTSARAYRKMAVVPVSALVIAAALMAFAPAALLSAWPLLGLWLLAPWIAHHSARPVEPTLRDRHLDEEQQRFARRVALRTWLFFERFVGPETHWLPPDNYHEAPRAFVSSRTSPTNIGLMLLATVAAYELGHQGISTLLPRIRQSFDTMERLQRYRGHFLNWYRLDDLAPLEPIYVSSVDSGNLAASLLVLSRTLQAMVDAPYSESTMRDGLEDMLRDLADLMPPPGEGDTGSPPAARIAALIDRVRRPADHGGWTDVLRDIEDRELPALFAPVLARPRTHGGVGDVETLSELRRSFNLVRRQVHACRHEQCLVPWRAWPRSLSADGASAAMETGYAALLGVLERPCGIRASPAACSQAEDRLQDMLAAAVGEQTSPESSALVSRLQEMDQQLRSAAAEARKLTAMADDLSRRAGELFTAMDFGFLYDRDRHLLRIGYIVSAGDYDPNYYDLLASEARLGSYVAIAKGDIPQEHWVHLGRPLTRIGYKRALVSWSATAFEYLMPHLLMRAPAQTLIGESCEVAIEQQQRFTKALELPWGISESGFYQLDKQAHYQYRAFGVPELGLRLEPDYRLVIAPYASALALPFVPRDALENLRHLADLNALGPLGFYEAIDFGREPRQGTVNRRGRLVRSYMSHHQGMILVALVNALKQDVFVHRFHDTPLVASCSHLIYEQIQSGAAPPIGWREQGAEKAAARSLEALPTWKVDAVPEMASLNVLSNEHYQVQISHTGVSGSFWKGLCLTRWQNDPCDMQGSCIYLRDLQSRAVWSAGSQPMAPRDAADCSTYFSPHMAEFHRRDHGINLTLSVAVCGREDVEVRSLKVRNDTDQPRRLLLVDYAEPVLAPPADHERHPAFNKLFVHTQAVPAEEVVLAHRRVRDEAESPVYFGRTVCEFGGRQRRLVYYTDRGEFLGRAGGSAFPAALCDEHVEFTRSGRAAGVDPILAIGIEIELPPRGSTEVAFLAAVGRRRADVLRLLAGYRSAPKVRWAFHRAEVHSQRLLSDLGMPGGDAQVTQAVHSAVLAVHPSLRQSHDGDSGDLRSLLWSRSISGDLPILMLHVRGFQDVELAEELLRMHLYWDRQQVAVDLVLLDSEIGGYDKPARTRLTRMLEASRERWRHYTQGSVYIVPAAELGEVDRNRLLAAAWAVFDPHKGSIRDQLQAAGTRRAELPSFVPIPSSRVVPEPTPELARPADLMLDNALGGFTADGRAYSIFLEPGQSTPAPWCNVIANPRFGCLISERGAMCTWSGNSGEHRLSPWHNDPLRDPSGESLFLRDEETGAVWSPLPQPMPADAPYRVTHGAGYSTVAHASHGLHQEVCVFVDREDPVKVVRVSLRNVWGRARRLTMTYYLEWVLGASRRSTRAHVVIELDRANRALYARNRFVSGGSAAFLASSEDIHGFTTDRREFLGLNGNPSRPAGLERIGLSSEVRNGGDPCAALQVHVDLAPQGECELCFVIGEGDDLEHARRLITRYTGAAERASSLQRVHDYWASALGTLQVETPDRGFDVMLNHWLLYQAIACRLWARAAMYQSGGGFGFRDQLQDVMALAASQPAVTRAQILRAAAAQFTEGDVLHWWHENPLRGVRTRCSDDLLWLVVATAHYVRTTGDDAILGERISYLDAPELSSDEGERYAEFPSTAHTETLYAHCRRALERGSTAGAHGLPLIGSGDWNDGLNRLGDKGRGESTWLGWFLVVAIREFAWLTDRVDGGESAQRHRERADELATLVDRVAWDGDWYLRAFDDDGTPVGSAGNEECRIDLNAQTWAVLARSPDEDHVSRAMAAAELHLADRDGLYRLLAPPFEHTLRNPGYIKGYPPGVRENGAQYSHAAVWAGWAYAEQGDGDRALRVFHAVSPVEHADRDLSRYRVEPYVVAADIYGMEPLTGRGGWTWYTGAAGWLYRLGVEGILGLRRHGDMLEVAPSLPAAWDGYRARWCLEGAQYDIIVERADSDAVGIHLDDVRLEEGAGIPLDLTGGCHRILVRVPRP